MTMIEFEELQLKIISMMKGSKLNLYLFKPFGVLSG